MTKYTPQEALELSLAIHRLIDNDKLLLNRITRLKYLKDMVNGITPAVDVIEDDVALANVMFKHFKKYLMWVLNSDEGELRYSAKRDHVALYNILYNGYITTKAKKISDRNFGIIIKASVMYEEDMFIETLSHVNVIDDWFEIDPPNTRKVYVKSCHVVTSKKCVTYPGWNIYGIIDNMLVSWYYPNNIEHNTDIDIMFKISQIQYNWEIPRLKETRLEGVKEI